VPYKDPVKQKERRKRYYHEVEKPKKSYEKIKKTKRKTQKKADRKKREIEARNYAWEFKRHNKCVRCGESDPACLVFHHTDPSNKKASVHKLYKYGLNSVKKEIDKCIILCANCHMKLHYYEKNDGEGITVSVKNSKKQP
jgi:hypothetical protein